MCNVVEVAVETFKTHNNKLIPRALFWLDGEDLHPTILGAISNPFYNLHLLIIFS